MASSYHKWTIACWAAVTTYFFADMELSSFEVDDEEKFFESHLQTITVSLVGGVQDATPSQLHPGVPSSSLPPRTMPRDQATPMEEPHSVGGFNKEWSVEPKSLLLSPADSGGEYGNDICTCTCYHGDDICV